MSSDIKSQLKCLIEHLEQGFKTETAERKVAREKALKIINDAVSEFEALSQNVVTTSDQMSAISQLQNIIFQLGNLNPEK